MSCGKQSILSNPRPTTTSMEPFEFDETHATVGSNMIDHHHLPFPVDGHHETHIFNPVEQVFLIHSMGGNLRACGGRVMKCYRNTAGIFIYAVETSGPDARTHHVPRWLCFHYLENAAYSLTHVMSDVEKEFLMDFCTPIASAGRAEGLINDLVVEYAEKFRTGRIPKTLPVPMYMKGAPAIGLASFQLVEDTPMGGMKTIDSALAETPRISPMDDSLLHHDQKHDCCCADHKKAVDEEWNVEGSAEKMDQAIMKYLCRVGNMSSSPQKFSFPLKADQTSHPSVEDDKCEGNVNDANDDVVSDSLTVDSVGEKDVDSGEVKREVKPTIGRFVEETVKENWDLIHLIKAYELAVITIALEAFSRIPSEQNKKFEDVRRTVSNELFQYYFCKPPKCQRFLTFDHFCLALRGDVSYCSLCGHHELFRTRLEKLHHFTTQHAIVSKLYECPGCFKSFRLPSCFRIHVVQCAPELAVHMRTDVINYIVDTYADFVAGKSYLNLSVMDIGPDDLLSTLLFTTSPDQHKDQVHTAACFSDVRALGFPNYGTPCASLGQLTMSSPLASNCIQSTQDTHVATHGCNRVRPGERRSGRERLEREDNPILDFYDPTIVHVSWLT